MSGSIELAGFDLENDEQKPAEHEWNSVDNERKAAHTHTQRACLSSSSVPIKRAVFVFEIRALAQAGMSWFHPENQQNCVRGRFWYGFVFKVWG